MRLALALIFCAGMVAALPPETSLRPVERATPDREPAAIPEQPEAPAPPESAEAAEMPESVQAVALSLRPALRPPRVVEQAVAVQQQRRRGSICGTLDVQGEDIGRVAGRIEGCGVPNAVRVRAVSGVSLTQRAVMDCRTAKALRDWVAESARPALSGIGGGLVRLEVAAHYSCRTRNGISGARISEHGRGRAIDISGFHLADGSLVTVEQGWHARATNQALRRMHRGACGAFGTVLGPDADSFHRDHFHFDTARYRSGTYCR